MRAWREIARTVPRFKESSASDRHASTVKDVETGLVQQIKDFRRVAAESVETDPPGKHSAGS